MTTSPPGSLLGARRPRVEHRPADVVDLSLVPLARDLSAMAGLPPDPWQGDSHEIMLGLREDGNFAAADFAEWVGRQQGKTGGIGVPRVLTGLFLLPERRFLWSAHLAATSTEAFEILREALLNLGEEIRPDLIEVPPLDLPGALREPLFVQVISANGKEGFRTWTADRRLEWRKRVLMVSRSKGGGRGIAADLRVVDETFAYTSTQQAALGPTRLAKPYSQTVYLSSPPLAGDEGEVMFRLRERAQEGDPRLGYRDWGLELSLDEFARLSPAQRRTFLFDRAHWAATLPALGNGRVTEESVEALLKEFADDLDAAREVLGLWPEQITVTGSWQVIGKADWDAQGGADADDWGAEAAFAVAMPEAQDWASIAVAGPSRTDPGEILVQVATYDRGSSWVIPRVLELVARYPEAPVAIAPNGPAGHLIAPLERAGVELVEPTQLEVAHAVQRFVRGVTDEKTIRHCSQESLDIAVKVALLRPYGDGGSTLLRRGGTDVSPLDAASLAVWAVEDLLGDVGPPLADDGPADTTATTADLAHIGF